MRTSNQLDEFLCEELNGSNIIWTDSSYSLPTRQWVTRDLCAAYKKTMFEGGIGYEKDKWDCDDFTLLNYWAVTTCLVISKLTQRQSDGHSIAVGMCLYERASDGRGHAIILAIVKEDDKLKVVFVEPQTSTEVELIENEKDNIFAVWI